MKRSSYGERDYAYGQSMLTLRTTMGLTQAGLADVLGVSRRAVAEWEGGSSYPKVDHLKRFITLAIEQQAFATGHDGEDIRALWKAALQKVLLDEPWLATLLSQYPPSSAPLPVTPPPGAEHISTVPSEELTLWMIPYARNPHFTGRDDLLSYLEQQFSPQGRDQSTTLSQASLTQSQAIKGLGGIGKTQTAVEYAYRAREQGRYTHTLWIAAASEETILASFVALVDLVPELRSQKEMDQRKLVAASIHWLEHCPHPWLLIVDNADDLCLIHPYLPQRGNGHVLFTTRASAVGSLVSFVEVKSMSVMEGTQFLLRRAHRFLHATDEEIDEAGNLVVLLAQFPLALDQAGAYLEETGCSVSDYLQIYQEHRHTLLARRGRQATGYPESVATTWSLSFQHIEQRNPAAAELLRLCAFLAPDHIPEELLTEGASYWPPVLQQAVADRFTFNQMLEALLAFSLVKRQAEHHALSIHRLVQVVQMERLEVEEQSVWTQRLVLALDTVFPLDPSETTSWPQCLRYLEQVQACDVLMQHYQLLIPEAADLLDRAGAYLHERALYTLAEPLFQQALHIWEQQERPEHSNSVPVLNHLAGLYNIQLGKDTQAKLLYQRALHIIEQQLGPEHLRAAYALIGLALVHTQEREYAQAESLYRRALYIREQQLGPEHRHHTESRVKREACFDPPISPNPPCQG
jgi:transcriptional regulator with XRE-family HTH domain/tetratricopeptide (TPR) repeat protein